MTEKKLTPLSTVREWATKRAEQSSYPNLFLSEFDDELKALRSGDDVEGRRLDLTDPVHLAAEIEALSAYRLLVNWNRRHALTAGRPKRYH